MLEMVFVMGLLTTWIRPLLSTVAIPATVDAAKWGMGKHSVNRFAQYVCVFQ